MTADRLFYFRPLPGRHREWLFLAADAEFARTEHSRKTPFPEHLGNAQEARIRSTPAFPAFPSYGGSCAREVVRAPSPCRGLSASGAPDLEACLLDAESAAKSEEQ